MHNFLHILFRFFLALAVLAGFLWLVDQSVAFRGEKVIEYHFGQPHGVLNHLQPVERAQAMTTGLDGVSYQRVIEDPLYIDMVLPVAYDRVKVDVFFDAHTSREIALGVKQSEGDWHFDITPVEFVSQEGRWTRGRVEFDLSGAARVSDKYTFIVSIPGLKRDTALEEYVDMASLDIYLYKKPFDRAQLQDIVRRISFGLLN